jgi:hypothetical protein
LEYWADEVVDKADAASPRSGYRGSDFVLWH